MRTVKDNMRAMYIMEILYFNAYNQKYIANSVVAGGYYEAL